MITLNIGKGIHCDNRPTYLHIRLMIASDKKRQMMDKLINMDITV
jgi:hypothetical protein